jgi:hypothetical protein
MGAVTAPVQHVANPRSKRAERNAGQSHLYLTQGVPFSTPATHQHTSLVPPDKLCVWRTHRTLALFGVLTGPLRSLAYSQDPYAQQQLTLLTLP